MSLDRLPPDNFGVRVVCADDRNRLLWLANQVGEDQLRSSVRKYRQRFIGSMPYVSKMLRWHGLGVMADDGGTLQHGCRAQAPEADSGVGSPTLNPGSDGVLTSTR